MLEYYLCWELRQYRTIFGEKGPKNLPKKAILWILDTQNFGNFYLTTTNIILMKLITIMHLHERLNRKALRARNSIFWLNIIALLIKLLYKLDGIWRSIPWKTTQNRFKIIATLTSLKQGRKLLSSRIMYIFKVFHLAQNVGRKSKGVRGRDLKTLRKWVIENVFFLYFRHLLRGLKNCKIYHVYTTGKNVIKIWAH